MIIAIKFLTKYRNEVSKNKDSASRRHVKQTKKILDELNEVRVTYLVRDDSYVHARQCKHRRSGHWRKYANGNKIWINSYIAGSDKDKLEAS